MPSTLDGVLLPGWMERDQAVAFLANDCHFDPPHSDAELEALWQQYRTRVEQLPDRPDAPPTIYALSPDEQQHATNFLTFLRQAGIGDIQSVQKVDLRQLVVHQFFVVTERADGYQIRFADDRACMEDCLPTAFTTPTVPFAFKGTQGFDTEISFDLPHAEFFFGPSQTGSFGPVQFTKHVTAKNVGNRMLLWSGYHRSYARVLRMPPTAAVWPALVAFTSNAIVPPPGHAGVTQAGAPPDLTIFGPRPPLFADFFDDGLRMVVKLRKKRYQLQVLARWVATNEP